MKTTNSFKARQRPFKGEVNNALSLTIPDQAISAQELLRRFATGQPLGFKNVTPVYDESEDYDVPELYKMSKIDRLHYLQENSDRVQDAKQNLEKYVNEQRIKSEAAKAEAEAKNARSKENAGGSERSGSEPATS